MLTIYPCLATNSMPFLIDPWSSGRAALRSPSSNSVNVPRPKFFATPLGPKRMGVAK